MSDAAIAQARRYYMHVSEGGTLTARDVGRMVEALEGVFQMYVDANEARIDAEAKLAKAVEVEKAQQLMNYYAVEIATYGATIPRLRNLEDAWTNLKTQTTLAELKGDTP